MGPLMAIFVGYAASNVIRANVESGVRAALSPQKKDEIHLDDSKIRKEHPELDKLYRTWAKAWWLAAASIVCTLFLPGCLSDFIGGWAGLLFFIGLLWCWLICRASHGLHRTYDAEVARLWNIYQERHGGME
jgi:hypothetical protein